MLRSFLAGLLLLSLSTIAQKLPTIEEKTASSKKQDGLFPTYWDEATGKFWLEIPRLDSEFLYVTTLPAGLGSNDIGLDRGLIGDSRIVKFVRAGRKILMVEPNYGYRAVSGSAREKAAADQSFAQSTLWGFVLEAASGDRILVDATEFLLRDAMGIANRIRNMRQGNYVLDKSRSALYLDQTKNFPLNTEIETTLTFSNNDGQTGEYIRAVVPSPEALTLRMHHSFVQLPPPGFEMRTFDPRSSFIPISYYDFSTPVSEPLIKYITLRHRLKKKNPELARSEPVKPIIYYLDNGTPEPIRSALLDGARWWNQAFEAAGYINAFQVQILPDSADPMDIRYNMINWVHRSTRGWSYGASVYDPRTGEIIKGNVTLGSLRVRQDYMIAEGLLAPYATSMNTDDPMLRMSLARLRQLAAHEIGHTLGLMHNYAASVSDRASVMDYPPPSVKLNEAGEIDLANAYATGIGSWDKASIAWGYSDFSKGSDTAATLDKILTDAASAGLQFISDRDARAPGGLHPNAHLWDNGQDVVSSLSLAMKVRNLALQKFGENNIRPGTPMAFLEDVLVPVYLYHRYQLEAVSKLVGGMNYTYAIRGKQGVITQPLSRKEQMAALEAVVATIDPKQLVLPERIAKLIPPRPAGYPFTRELFRKRTGLAFDVLTPAENGADLPISLLMNTERLNRLAEGNALSLQDMLDYVSSKTWKSARRGGMEALIQMQTEQIFLTYLLAVSIDDNASFATRSVVRKFLNDLTAFLQQGSKSANALYAGHCLLALDRMKAPEKAKPTIHAETPPGAPIGCDAD